MHDDDDLTQRQDHEVLTLLGEIDALDRQRASLGQQRTRLINQLLANLGISRKALAAFLARRKLSEDDRAHWDASLAALCDKTGMNWQPDLFDLEPEAPEPSMSAGMTTTH